MTEQQVLLLRLIGINSASMNRVGHGSCVNQSPYGAHIAATWQKLSLFWERLFPDYPESTFICELFEMLFNYYSSNFN
jgi:hypothetical protein